MKSHTTVLAIAIGIGVLLTLVFTGVAYWAYQLGAEGVARILSWPNTLLQGLVRCHNIGSTDKPLCEGTPVNLLAYILSFPLSAVAYTVAAYFLIRRWSVHGA